MRVAQPALALRRAVVGDLAHQRPAREADERQRVHRRASSVFGRAARDREQGRHAERPHQRCVVNSVIEIHSPSTLLGGASRRTSTRRSCGLVELAEDDREPVLVGVLADEHVEVAVAGHDVQRVAAGLAAARTSRTCAAGSPGGSSCSRPPVMNEKRASVCGACATKLSGSSGRPSTLTRCPSCTHLAICLKNVSGAAPNSPFVHSCVSGLSCSCVHSVGSPGAEHEARHLADAVVALAPRELAVRGDGLRQDPRRVAVAPLRVEVARQPRRPAARRT